MGMFDTVVCRYPLPHHQDAEFQTKDLAAVALCEHGFGGFMDDYEVTKDGRLRRHLHEREWTEDPDAPFGGWLRSVRDWWEDVPDAHGDVVIYTSRDAGNQASAAWTKFRLRFTNGRVQDVHEVPTADEPARPLDDPDAEPKPSDRPAQDECDLRPEVQDLLASLNASAAALRQLRRECNDHWGYEDPVYRFYHQSFKVYGLQDTTTRIVTALEGLRPGHPLHPWFAQIVRAGTGRAFTRDDNARWSDATRPIVEAFFHARYFLEMAVRYAGRFEMAPRLLPSGWAALLELYGLR
jgi:hypothetical protein